MPHDLFLSYRRSDAAGHARNLHDRLCQSFDAEQIFFDRGSIESGDVFPETLRAGIDSAKAVLALIGPDWLTVAGAGGRPRLDDPADFVRREVAAALAGGKRVIPVLFDDAPMPKADQLPDDLKALTHADGLTLRGKNYEFEAQLAELVRLIVKVGIESRPVVEGSYLVPAPALDYQIVGRAALIEKVWTLLLDDGHRGHGGLVFQPGVGKTSVAMQLVLDKRRVFRHFEGVLWADVGRDPKFKSEILKWAAALGIGEDERGGPSDEVRLANLIKARIGGRRMLIVLDDVWKYEDAKKFLDLCPLAKCIVTSRVGEIAVEVTGNKTVVPDLTEDEGFELLSNIAGYAVEYDPARTRALVRIVGGLPQALVLIGKYLRKKATTGNKRKIAEAFAAMEVAGRLADQSAENETEAALERIIQVSFDALGSDLQREALVALSIFRPKPNAFSAEIAAEVCNVTDNVLDELFILGLIEKRFDPQGNDPDSDLAQTARAGTRRPANDEMLYTTHRVIAGFARKRLAPERSRLLNARARDYYARWLLHQIEGDPKAYQSWYCYEHPRWQSKKDAWMYHLAHTGEHRAALHAFLRVYFDAFWWWGYYQRFPFCERLLEEWQARNVQADVREGLRNLTRFQEAYPCGYEKRDRGDWTVATSALEAIREGAGLGGDPAALVAPDARQVRGFIDFFLAEAYAYSGGEQGEALARYDAVRELFKRDGNTWVAGWIEFYVANYLQEEGDNDAARERCRRSLALADETKPLDKRDPEILANVYRLLGDLDIAGNDMVAATTHYRRAAFYAYAFQGIPEPADSYTNDFYREITGRIAGQALKLHRAAPASAVALCDDLCEFFAPVRDGIGLPDIGESTAAMLVEGAHRQLVAYLFPPDIPDELLDARAREYQAQVLRAVGALEAAAHPRALR